MGAGAPERGTDSGCRRIVGGDPRRILELQILSDSDRSHCEAFNAGVLHNQAACLQKGDDRERESVPGETKKSTKNRVLALLAAVIGRAMIVGRRRSEEREAKEHRKRKH